jgi:hypothetical protein
MLRPVLPRSAANHDPRICSIGIGRFGLLRDYLAGRDPRRENLSRSSRAIAIRRATRFGLPVRPMDFDELWLFAVATGDGLTAEDCGAI